MYVCMYVCMYVSMYICTSMTVNSLLQYKNALTLEFFIISESNFVPDVIDLIFSSNS